jgi:hypothetical protein
VERVRNAVSYPSIYKNKHPFYQSVPDIVIVPLDSRNWAEIGEDFVYPCNIIPYFFRRLHGEEF